MAEDAVDLRGGLDLTSTYQKTPPGSLLRSLNVESITEGGYRRILGDEVFDGQPAPSEATYFTMTLTDLTGVLPNTTLTGGTSGATAYIISVLSDRIAVVEIVGTFLVGETTNYTGNVATLPVEGGISSLEDDLATLTLAQDRARTFITEVPGSGDLRGFKLYNGVGYAFRDNVGATACDIYSSSAAGWVGPLPLPSTLFYDAGVGSIVDDIIEGTAINNGGGSTAVVERLGVLTASTGWMVVTSVVGVWADNDPIQVAAANKATLDGTISAVTIAPGGHYEFITHNFGAAISGLRVYGTDGVNPAFEFDGSLYAPILVGVTPNTPKYLEVHVHHLFLSFPEGRLINSVPDQPFNYNGAIGSGDIPIGNEITGLVSQPQTLIIYTDNETNVLYGDTADPLGGGTLFRRNIASREYGGRDYTAQVVGIAMALTNQGVVLAKRGDEHGNFTTQGITDKIKDLIISLKDLANASVTMLNKNQYRIYFNTGINLFITFNPQGVEGITVTNYGREVKIAYKDYDTDGTERMFYGSEGGFVYEAERGTTMNGDFIDWLYQTNYIHAGSPQVLKSYERMQMQVSPQIQAVISIRSSLSRGTDDVLESVGFTETADGAAGFFDFSDYGEFIFGGRIIGEVRGGLSGIGTDISYIVSGSSKTDDDFEMRDILYHYKNLRVERY